ncbi:MAG: type II secretion system F family protein [Deltaproteobacteria bacterium]|nr:type II secretion system F family protein [Deltaproteobacteria bacterium]
MPKFAYKARNKNGTLVQGFLDGDDMANVKSKLAEQGLIPISVSSAKASMGLSLSLMFKKRVSPEEIVLFTKQFSTLFKAGMGMENILNTLAKQSKNPTMQETLSTIKNDIQQGSSLANAFGKHGKVFDDLYINMLSSGEEAGILEEVLFQLADVLEKDFAMRKGVKSAMLYPKIVIGVLVAATSVLMIMVVPKFKEIFDSLGAELPLPTKIMIWTSNFMTDYFFFLIMGAIGSKILFNKYYSTPKGRHLVDKLTFKIPVFGPLALKVANARFANILACLYRSGLPVTKALSITGATIGNDAFMRDVKILQSDVEKGHGIADTMRGLKYFSPVIVEATAIGEKTGSLDSMLTSIGEHYDMEINHTIKNLTTLLEPILLVIIFSMVAVFALAIFLPIWSMSGAMLK